jgi:hypothetical protein
MWRSILLIPFLFTSCYTYQYFTLKNDHLQQNNKHEFVLENDTLKITYNFNGKDCPVVISLFNKASKPLLIDWKKSAVIVNDTAISLYSNAYQINGQETGARFGHVYSANLSGKVVGHEETAFIPPNASITRSLITLTVQPIEINEFGSQKKVGNINQTSIKFQEKEFASQNTPFQFRNYLTFKFQGEEKEFNIENSFYVSNVKFTMASPPVVGDTSGNTFYIKTPL